ncbi:MAG TPA: energy transducer TonB [Flavisolibacter sp.]|nr:energy transducer TonB [Flavisolibacter sp.]
MKCSLAFLFVLPLFCFSQNVRVNVYDKFLKKHRIELEPVTIQLPAGKGRISIGFTSVASSLYVEVSGSGWGASTIDAGNELIFLFSNDSVVTVRSTALQTFEPGINLNTYKHQYSITQADLDLLSRFELIGLRKYSFKDFSDIRFPKLNAAKVRGRSTLFMAELKKANVLKTIKYINLKDINKYIGDSVEFCTKVYNARYFESSENGPTLLDVQSNFSDPVINAVVLKQDRKNFNNMPEKLYINKDVCISGVVTVRNNVPYLVIRDRGQVKVKSPISLSEIESFIGDSVTVAGKVHTARYFSESKTQPTLLNMGAPFPDQILTVVIENADRKYFTVNPEVYYLNKEILVTGKVVLFKSKPQIVIRSKDQIRVLKDSDLLPTITPNIGSGPQPIGQQAMQKSSSEIGISEKSIIIAAEFPGGAPALVDFLNKNLRCPAQLKINELKTVIANFDVNVDGSLSNIKISQSAGAIYDKEVIRVLQNMPKWKPKSKNGFFVSAPLTQAITFKRDDAREQKLKL